MIYFFVFIFIISACIASFLNVVLDRYKTGESIVFKPSHCFNCKNNIFWWHNIPIFSYLFLGGKCYFCKINIPKRHLLLEVFLPVVVILFTGFIFYQSPGVSIIILCLVALFLIVLIFLSLFDLRYKLIPHETTYLAIFIFVLADLLDGGNKLTPFINIGVAFLFLDLLNAVISTFKKYALDSNLIVVPVLLWTLYFLISVHHLFYFILLPVVIYFALTKSNFNIRNNYLIFLWFLSLFFLLVFIFKGIFIDFTFQDFPVYFAGIGSLYFICEVMFYLFSLMLSSISKMPLQTQDKEEKIALGGGDITVFALISAFLGYKLAFSSLFIASLLAIISHLFWVVFCQFSNRLKFDSKVSKNIPFVPYLMVACFIVILIIYG